MMNNKIVVCGIFTQSVRRGPVKIESTFLGSSMYYYLACIESLKCVPPPPIMCIEKLKFLLSKIMLGTKVGL